MSQERLNCLALLAVDRERNCCAHWFWPNYRRLSACKSEMSRVLTSHSSLHVAAMMTHHWCVWYHMLWVFERCTKELPLSLSYSSLYYRAEALHHLWKIHVPPSLLLWLSTPPSLAPQNPSLSTSLLSLLALLLPTSPTLPVSRSPSPCFPDSFHPSSPFV